MKVSERLSDLEDSAVSSILSRAAGQDWSDVLPLAGGEPRFKLPSSVARDFEDQQLLASKITKYSPFCGIEELLQRIKDKLQIINRIKCDVTDLIVVPGGSAGLSGALAAIVNPGDQVVVPDPCWEHYIQIIRLFGAEPVRFRMHFNGTRYEPDFSDLRSKLGPRVAAVLVNTPLNPCGAVLSESECAELVAITQEFGVWLVSDEEYESFTYGKTRVASPRALSESVISVYSFSKSFSMTGIRLGYVVAPQSIVKLIRRYALYTYMYPPTPSQYMALAALQGSYVDYLDELRCEYERKAARLIDGLAKISGVSCWQPEGGVYLFPRMPVDSDRELVEELISREHLLSVPGSVAGSLGRGHIRLFVGVADDLLDEAVVRLRRFFETRLA